MVEEFELIVVALLTSPFVRVFTLGLLLLIGLGFRDWSAGLLAVLFGVAAAYSTSIERGVQWLPSEGTALSDYVEQRAQFVDASQSTEAAKTAGSDTFVESDSPYAALAHSVFDQFQMGLKQGMHVLIPFLVIELLVAVFLLLARLESVSVLFASLPLKIFFFLSVGGVESLQGMMLGTA